MGKLWVNDNCGTFELLSFVCHHGSEQLVLPSGCSKTVPNCIQRFVHKPVTTNRSCTHLVNVYAFLHVLLYVKYGGSNFVLSHIGLIVILHGLGWMHLISVCSQLKNVLTITRYSPFVFNAMSWDNTNQQTVTRPIIQMRLWYKVVKFIMSSDQLSFPLVTVKYSSHYSLKEYPIA